LILRSRRSAHEALHRGHERDRGQHERADGLEHDLLLCWLRPPSWQPATRQDKRGRRGPRGVGVKHCRSTCRFYVRKSHAVKTKITRGWSYGSRRERHDAASRPEKASVVPLLDRFGHDAARRKWL